MTHAPSTLPKTVKRETALWNVSNTVSLTMRSLSVNIGESCLHSRAEHIAVLVQQRQDDAVGPAEAALHVVLAAAPDGPEGAHVVLGGNKGFWFCYWAL